MRRLPINGRVDHVDGNHVALHVHLGAGRGDESGLVGVVVVDVDHGVEAALDQVGEQKLHVSGFVAAERETGGVVSFDEDARDGFDTGIHRIGDCGAQPRSFFKRCAEPRQLDPWEFSNAVEDCLVVHLSALTLTLFRRAGALHNHRHSGESRNPEGRCKGGSCRISLPCHRSIIQRTRTGEGIGGLLIWEPTAFSGSVVDGHDLTGANARYRFQRIFADIDVAVAVDKLPFAFVDAEDGEIGVGARCHAAQHAFSFGSEDGCRVYGSTSQVRLQVQCRATSPSRWSPSERRRCQRTGS